MAYALDLLGERWTLLIVRELFLGPRRFGDLHSCLPGLGTNLLSKRLKELEEAGLVIAPTGGPSHHHYRLSDTGEALRPTVRSLMFWSIEYFMARPEPSPPRDCIFSNDIQPDSVALAIEMFANMSALPHDNYVLQLVIDEHRYTYYFMNKEMIARRGADTPAVARIETDVATLMQAMRGEIYIPETKARSSMSGNEKVIDHFIVGFTPGAEIAFEVAELIKQRRAETLNKPIVRANAPGNLTKPAVAEVQ